jgi:hypothetical protein
MYSPKRRFRLFRQGVSSGGSISLSATGSGSGSAVNVANADGHFDITSGTPFTIEWFQYLIAGGGSAPRAFAFGNYTAATTILGVSQEGSDSSRIFYVWTGPPRTARSIGTLSPNVLNTWVHFAVVGDGTNIRVYRDGTQIGSAFAYASFSTTLTLAIGNETNPNTIGAFGGYLTNFRWVTGTAVYTGAFTRPSQPLTAIPGTRLLLLASSSGTVTNDSSSYARETSTGGTVTWASNSPFV